MSAELNVVVPAAAPLAERPDAPAGLRALSRAPLSEPASTPSKRGRPALTLVSEVSPHVPTPDPGAAGEVPWNPRGLQGELAAARLELMTLKQRREADQRAIEALREGLDHAAEAIALELETFRRVAQEIEGRMAGALRVSGLPDRVVDEELSRNRRLIRRASDVVGRAASSLLVQKHLTARRTSLDS